MHRRPAPSAGGLYPLEMYVAARSVDGLADGFYHYNVPRHELEPLPDAAPLDQLSDVLLVQPYVQSANVLVFLAAVFSRTLRRYGPRGYRYMLLEAGHVGQNLCLLAAELGLGTLCVGGFQDGMLNAHLGLDGRNEAVLYCVCAGFPHPSATDATKSTT